MTTKRKPTPTRIGVIGLGNMGRGIAKNLIKAGHDVFVWDVAEAARQPYADTATIAEPAEMAGKCAMIIFVVPGSPEIDGMLKGRNSMLARPRRGLVLYDFTTSDPTYTKKLAKRAAAEGLDVKPEDLTPEQIRMLAHKGGKLDCHSDVADDEQAQQVQAFVQIGVK